MAADLFVQARLEFLGLELPLQGEPLDRVPFETELVTNVQATQADNEHVSRLELLEVREKTYVWPSSI